MMEADGKGDISGTKVKLSFFVYVESSIEVCQDIFLINL